MPANDQLTALDATFLELEQADPFEMRGFSGGPIVNARGIYAQATARRNIDAARESFDDARRRIASGLVHSMLTTLAASRAAELNRVGLRAALERLELAKTKVRFRQGTALDVERAEQDAASARSTLITGDESLRQAREALGVALGSSVATLTRQRPAAIAGSTCCFWLSLPACRTTSPARATVSR